MELKENINDIVLEKLESSYLNDNLKSIIICIESLRRIGLIKDNIILNLTNEIDLANVIEIIRNIEFIKPKEPDLKKLVKTI